MKVSTRNLQQALLLCIGIAFLAPSLWFHYRMVDVSCHQQQQQRHGPVVSLAASREALELDEESRGDHNGKGNAVIDSRITADSASSSTSSSNSICGSTLLSTRSPYSLWMDHLPQILQNSRLRQDYKNFQLHDLTLQVLQLYTPRLPLSVRTLTRNPAHLNALFQKTRERYNYLLIRMQQQQARQGGETRTKIKKSSSTSPLPPPPPVKIVVLGGSVTAGVNCISGIGNANLGLCAWPLRLETLINGMVHDMIIMNTQAKAAAEAVESSSSATKPRQQQQHKQSTLPPLPPLVEVHVFAIGGSNTQTATTLLEYDLLPRLAKNPDIVINAYSTNDMHVDTVKMATSLQKTLSDLVFDMMQDFVRVVLRPRSSTRTRQSSCHNQQKQQQQHTPPPVLLWLDDYLGNEQRLIMETTAVSKAMHLLANYYGFASISYADAIRDVVYGDTHEQLFSPHWYKGLGGNGNKKNNNNNIKGGGGGGDNFAREIHPGQGMHMAAAWTVAYNLLHLATHYCSLQHQIIPPSVGNEQTASESQEGEAFSPWPGLPQLRRVKQIGGSIANVKPGPTPDTLPPPLTDTLNLRRVSADWQESHQAFLQKADDAAAAENNDTSPAANCSQSEKDNDDGDYERCPFSWIVGLPVNGRNVDLFHERESNAQDDMKEIHDYFVQHATKSDLGGWQVQDDSNRKKYGWVPPPPPVATADATELLQPKSTMKLEFWNLTQPIRTITLFTMRSYGDKWANSTVKVVISTAAPVAAARRQSSNGKGNDEKVDWNTVVEKEMTGFHDKHTSEMYTEPIQLQDPIQPGEGLKIAITLIQGTTFKIQGMAVCS